MTSFKKQQNSIEKRIFLLVATIGIFMFGLYIYFVSASVVHVVIRTEINQEIKKVSSEISLLEGRLITAQHKISSDIASLQGYIDTSDKIFIDRVKPVFVLSSNVW